MGILLIYLFVIVVLYSMSTHRDHPRLAYLYWLFNTLWLFAWGLKTPQDSRWADFHQADWLGFGLGALLSWLLIGRPFGWRRRK